MKPGNVYPSMAGTTQKVTCIPATRDAILTSNTGIFDVVLVFLGRG
jgi:hypothetical protein